MTERKDALTSQVLRKGKIGLLGAGGRIGSEILHAINKLAPEIEVICGSRAPRNQAWQQVDASDTDSLSAFAKDCELLINASGVHIRGKGMKIIELGDEPCTDGDTVVYGCGAAPGLLGLLPLMLAERFTCVERICVDYMINEPMTLTAARDMATRYTTSGHCGSGSYAKPQRLPLFGDAVYRYPYSDEESRGVEKMLGVTQGMWSMVRRSDDLERLLAKPHTSCEELAKDLVEQSRVAQLGQKNAFIITVLLHGELNGQNTALTAFAQCSSPAALSGKMCAATAIALYYGALESGVYRLPLCGNRKAVWELFMRSKPFDTYHIYPYELEDDAEDDGEI